MDQTLEGHRNAKDAKKRLQESKRKIGVYTWCAYMLLLLLLHVIVMSCCHQHSVAGVFILSLQNSDFYLHETLHVKLAFLYKHRYMPVQYVFCFF